MNKTGKTKTKRRTKTKKKAKRMSEEKEWNVEKHMKQRFRSNEEGWISAYNYFRMYLNVLLLGYASTRQQPCVIFDIDHTVVYYWTPLIASMTPAHLLGPMMVPRKELRLTSVVALNLYNLFLQNGVPIYFVTARPGSATNRTATEQELKTVGFHNYKDIYYMPSIFDNVGRFKEGVRNGLRAKHPILFNVGDQWTDFINEHVDTKYDDEAFLLFNMEPGCDWGLKLVTPKSHPFRLGSSSNGGTYNSVFETMAPINIKESEVCSECGHLKIYH